MIMHWPQITMAALFAISTGMTLSRFGEEKKRDRYDLVDLLAPGITIAVLYFGGFWTGC